MTNQTNTSSSGDQLVTIQIDLDRRYGDYRGKECMVRAVSRILAYRHSPSSRVELDDGVMLVRGGFPPRGGTKREPALKWQRKTVLEVEDVPAWMAEEEVTEAYGVTIVDQGHTERCAEDRRRAVQWRKAHPRYCRECGGAGGTVVSGVRYYADGSGEPDLFEACPECLAIGRCPWCHGRLKIASQDEGLYRCRVFVCGWDEQDSDRAPLGAWECVCWEDKMEETELERYRSEIDGDVPV